MKIVVPRSSFVSRAFLINEALIYIAVLFVLLGVGYTAVDHCIDNSVALRRSADDLSRALAAGERWRGDIRAADQGVRRDSEPNVLSLAGRHGRVAYRFDHGVVYRQTGQGPWVRFLERVKSSEMRADPRSQVTAWRWELELQPQTTASVKPGRFRPLFTFLAVPPAPATP